MVELITDYLEDRMDLEARERFERHVAVCDGCAIYLDQMRVTILATGAIRGEDLPEPRREELVAAFRALFG